MAESDETMDTEWKLSRRDSVANGRSATCLGVLLEPPRGTCSSVNCVQMSPAGDADVSRTT